MKSIIRTMLLAATILCSVQVSGQELRMSGTWKNIKAHPAPLPVIGEITTIQSDLNADSFWSVGSETLDRDYAVFENYKKYLKDTGVGYARLQSGWAKTEKEKGKYDFSWIDAHVDGLIEEGIHPWMCLCYGNPIYSDHGLNLNARLFPDGPIMDAWLNYVRACVTRYKGKVTMWEVWNEPDGGKNKDSYELYANLFVRTAKLIKEIDPDAKVASFGVCSPNKPYIRQSMEFIAKADGVKYMDYLTYHAYWQNPETVIPAVKQLRKDIDAYSPSIGLLQGETGCPSQLEYGHAMSRIEWTEYSQAKWDLRQSLTHFALGVPYSFFTMVDLNYGWMHQSFGLVRMDTNKKPIYKRPKYYAVQHVTSVFTPDMKVTDEVTVQGPYNVELTSYGLQKDGKNVGCMLWLSGERPSDTLERKLMDITIYGMKFTDPVYVDMLTGYVHEMKDIIKKGRGGDARYVEDLPLWDCPVLIINKSALNIKTE